MKTNEIDFLDLDEENRSYYEVELWRGGDCEGHFFARKADALRYFAQHGENEYDCVKHRRAYREGGDVAIVAEMERR